MKVSTQQLLIAALAGGFIQEALALALPNPAALSTTNSAIDKSVVVDKRRNEDIVPLSSTLLPRADDDNGDDGDSSVELFQRSIFARGGGTGHDDGHVDGTGHDGTTGDGTETTTGDGQQSDTTGGLTSGDDTTTGGLTSDPSKDPPVVACKRGGDCTYNSAGYPDKPKGPSSGDKKTLENLEKRITNPDKNSAVAYTARYKKEQNEYAKYRADAAQEAKDEEATFKKFSDNYDMVKADRKALTDQEIKDATALGIKDPGKLQIWDIFSKTNGKRDANKMAEILVSDDGTTVVSSYTFAKFDGNLNKLDNKGNPKSTGADTFEQQTAQYIKDHRLSNSDINWSFLNKITDGDKAKAQAITFWMREHIINKGTLAQVYRSHFAMGWGANIRGKFTYKGDSKNPQEIKEYQALMGTENLSPLGYMYADHVQYFDGRYPLEIYTYPFDETNIWVKIGKPDGGNLPKVA